MDKKQLFTGVALAMAVVGLWYLFVFYLEKTHPELVQPAAAATQPAEPTAAPAVPSTQAAAAPTTTAATSAAAAPASQPGLRALAGEVTLLKAIGSETKDSPYKMLVALNPKGAAVDSVTLNEFHSSENYPKKKEPYVFQGPYPGHMGTNVLATRTVIINGATIDLTDVVWHVGGSDSASATFTLPLQDASGKIIATLSKAYRVTLSTEKTQGYELEVTYGIANTSGAPLTVQTTYNGTTTPPKEIERGADRAILAGYDLGRNDVEAAQHMIEEFKPSAPSMDLTKNKDGKPALWAGAGSTYFDAIVSPARPRSAPRPPTPSRPKPSIRNMKTVTSSPRLIPGRSPWRPAKASICRQASSWGQKGGTCSTARTMPAIPAISTRRWWSAAACAASRSAASRGSSPPW